MIILDPEEFIILRTPSDLCKYIDGIYGQVMADKNTLYPARLKKGPYKKFLEELIPLGIFSKYKFLGLILKIGV